MVKRNLRFPDEVFEVSAPIYFSLVENISEMIDFANLIERYLRKGRRVFIDLSSTAHIEPDGILYLLSKLASFRRFRASSKLMGNSPSNKKAKDIFLHSGFYNYVSSSFRTPASTNILSIKTGKKVQSPVVRDVVDFVIHHSGKSRVELRPIYEAGLEVIGNTTEHADPNVQKPWWIMALRDEELNEVKFACIDRGQGIPQTIRKRLGENIIAKIGLKGDEDFLESALQGEHRSSTNMRYRGRGLPQVLSIYNDGLVNSLGLISRKGYIHYRQGKPVVKKSLDIELRGTLFTWNLSLGENENEHN